MKLTKKDYIDILIYYNQYKNNMKIKEIKYKAEDILSKKLCKCINNVNNEKYKIPICINNVITRKNLKISKFKCKKKPSLMSLNKINITKTKKYNRKNKKNKKTRKTRKNINY